MTMKRSLSLLFAAVLAIATQAHEGMWLLTKLKQVNEAEMQKLGFKLTAEDIYAINRSGIKDAVVRLGGGFCSGEMVSAEGLFLTNHHCGYDAIQGLSSVEHDYLTDGFWAMNREQELPAGFNVSFLQRIDDVTAQVMAELNDAMTEDERNAKVQEVGAKLRGEVKGNGMSADFKVMFEGNEFYLFVYKTYRDVRLVGTPPSAIGKFGGDTDNWMWPRHTGDFSMFRVYTGPDGEPADYDKANVPFKPAHHFPVSTQGVKEGDFAMVMGYPGSTDRFLSSHGVKLALDIEQPSRVKIRRAKLDIYDEFMKADNKVRIQYASKYASVSNYWKYFIGQQRGLKRLRVYDKKKAQEDELMAWVNANADRKAKYGDIVTLLERGYNERTKFEKANTYMQEAAFGSEAIILGFRMMGLKNQLATDPKDAAKVSAMVARVQAAADEFWKDYNPATDEKVTATMFRMMHTDVERDLQPTVMNTIEKKYKGNFEAWAKCGVQHQHAHRPRQARCLPGQAHAEGTGEGPRLPGLRELPEPLPQRARPCRGCQPGRSGPWLPPDGGRHAREGPQQELVPQCQQHHAPHLRPSGQLRARRWHVLQARDHCCGYPGEGRPHQRRVHCAGPSVGTAPQEELWPLCRRERRSSS